MASGRHLRVLGGWVAQCAWLCGVALGCALAGCASVPDRVAVPAVLSADAVVPGLADVRVWGDAHFGDWGFQMGLLICAFEDELGGLTNTAALEARLSRLTLEDLEVMYPAAAARVYRVCRLERMKSLRRFYRNGPRRPRCGMTSSPCFTSTVQNRFLCEPGAH